MSHVGGVLAVASVILSQGCVKVFLLTGILPQLFLSVPAYYSLEYLLPLALTWSPFREKVVVEVSQLLPPHPYCPDGLEGDTEGSHDLGMLQFLPRSDGLFDIVLSVPGR